jgi:hypothetical protein
MADMPGLGSLTEHAKELLALVTLAGVWFIKRLVGKYDETLEAHDEDIQRIDRESKSADKVLTADVAKLSERLSVMEATCRERNANGAHNPQR